MKKLTLVLAALTSLTLLPSLASAKAPIIMHEQALIKICDAIQADKRLVLKKRMQSLKLSSRALVTKLKCNNLDPISFANQMGSQKTADYLTKRSGKAFLLSRAKEEESKEVTQ